MAPTNPGSGGPLGKVGELAALPLAPDRLRGLMPERLPPGHGAGPSARCYNHQCQV